MSELRLNLVTREWVVIATERAKRPTDYANGVPLKAPLPEHLSSCPFCPGNEHRTPQERHRLPDDGSWTVRVRVQVALEPLARSPTVQTGEA